MYRGFHTGPRGRMFGPRGFRPGIFSGIIGLFVFLWIIVAVIGSVFGAGMMILSSALHSLQHYFPRLLGSAFFLRSLAVGAVIGLIWYLRTHKRNTAKEETLREDSGTVDGAPVETEVTEPQRFHTFSA